MTKRKKIALIPFIAATVFSAVILLTEIITPLDRLHTADAYEFQNTAVGGNVTVDGDIVYYVSPGGSIRAKGKASDFKISNSGSTLQAFKNGVVFLDGGNLIYSDISGTKKETMLKNVGDYFLSGNWLYYTETGSNTLKKMRLTDSKKFNVGVKVNGDFAVRGNTLMFIGDKNYLYTARTDGSNVTPFLGRQVDSFMFYGNYVYFSVDGIIKSVANKNTASMHTYFEADGFTVYNDTLFFIKDGQLNSLDLTDPEAKQKKIPTKGENPTEVYVSEKYLYYYLADGSMYRCDFYGMGTVEM